MQKRWMDLNEDKEAELFTTDFWNKNRKDITTGKFWADEIKKSRSEPEKRLSLALKNLPLPHAFKEAAIALRAIIKLKKVDSDLTSITDELKALYQLAVINSFMIPYAENLKEPGFNVMESVPGKLLFNLPVDYYQIGYEQIELLNKSDIKLLIKVYGEPESHTTLHELYKNIWIEYENRLIKSRKKSITDIFFC